MHTFYKEHQGSYAVAVPWPTTIAGSHTYTDWHVLFSGLSLDRAMFVVRYLNGGPSAPSLDPAFMRVLEECAS